MKYYTYEQYKEIPSKMDETLQKYLPTNNWGCVVLMNLEGVCEHIEVCTVARTGGGRHGDEELWTHYANLALCGDGKWEVNEQFKGEKENEMWVYGTYKSFGAAVRNLATIGTKNRKPVEIF